MRWSPAQVGVSVPQLPNGWAADGAHVILTARTAKDLETVEQRIFEAGGNATIAPLDLAEAGSIDRLAAAVRERWGRLDTLVMNAARLGTLTPVPMIDAPPNSIGC